MVFCGGARLTKDPGMSVSTPAHTLDYARSHDLKIPFVYKQHSITCFTIESPTPPSRPPTNTKTPARQLRAMPQPRKQQITYTEGDLQLAIQDINSQQLLSERRAAAIYKVPRRTLIDRRAGRRPRRDCEPNRKRLTKLEEEAVVLRILDESDRGISSSKADVRDMADKLLRERGGDAVGKNWVDRLIQRTPELRTRWTRPYDRQRAACEDPAVIQP